MTAERPLSAPGGPATAGGHLRRTSGERLAAVDGLRALAALWVVLFHMRSSSGVVLWPGIDLVARAGPAGVSLFLVLSGFCLYRPYAAGRGSRFDTRRFLRRRVVRLYPAYCISLLCVLVLHSWVRGRWGIPHEQGADLHLQVVTHLSMTHVLLPDTFYGLNSAYWSLGLEWQLYLLLPLLLALVRRRGFGVMLAAVLIATVLYRLSLDLAVRQAWIDGGRLATAVLPNLFLGRWAEFGLGMLVAELQARGRLRRTSALLTCAAAGALLVVHAGGDHALEHVASGLTFSLLLCAVLSGEGRLRRLLEWRPLVSLGLVSYSVYLLHQPVFQLVAGVLGAEGADPSTVFGALVLVLPAVLVAASALSWVAERDGGTRAQRQAPTHVRGKRRGPAAEPVRSGQRLGTSAGRHVRQPHGLAQRRATGGGGTLGEASLP